MANKNRPIIDDSNGNVGISTLSVPTSKLQVGGNVVPDLSLTYSLGLPSAQWISVNSAYVTTSVAIRAPFAALNTISASGVSASIIDFTSGSNPPWSEGNVFYDWGEHSLAVYNDNSQVTYNVGQETVEKVFNPSAGNIPVGTPVYISTSNASGFPQIYPALADGGGVKYSVAGVTDSLISGSGYGYICTIGVVHGTQQNFAAGTPLWLSPLNSGSYATTPPTASFEKYQVGMVIASGSSGTDILVLPNEHSYGATSASYAYSASYVPIGRSIVLCAAFTPTTTGADPAEISIPFSPLDGTSSMTWNVKRLSLRTQTVETTTSSIGIEKSSVAGAFNATSIGTVVLPFSSYEAFSGSLSTVTSGDKIRFNVTTLGTSQNWTVITEISNT